jgi:hypothetical protein
MLATGIKAGLVAAFLLTAAHNPAVAGVITFSGLTGPNQAPFTTYTEGNFTVTPVSGALEQGTAFGNPAPSVLGGPLFSPVAGSMMVTENTTGQFTFTSVDIASNNGSSTYELEGFCGSSVMFDQKGSVPGAPGMFNFDTIYSNDPLDAFNSLLITVTPGAGVSSFNVDNIVVTTASKVPEPTTFSLLSFTSLLAAAWFTMRRTRP